MSGNVRFDYNPLRNDAQAMALVKKFRLEVDTSIIANDDEWGVISCSDGMVVEQSIATDLNRAIVECVAKMRKAAQ
jgi:hypothetical protein